MSMSSTPIRTSSTHLPFFLDLPSLDLSTPLSPPPPLPLLPLYSLHHTLPTPLTLHSYLHAILLHLAHAASIPQSFSPSSITTALHHFTHHLSTRLLSHSSPQSLSAVLSPLVDVLPFSRVAREGPVIIEWVDEFTVAFTANVVSHALRFMAGQSVTVRAVVTAPHAFPSSIQICPGVGSSPALCGAMSDWLCAVQRLSCFPCTPTRDCAAQLNLTLRLLLAPLHALRLSQAECSTAVEGAEWQTDVCWAIADVFFHSASPASNVSGEVTWSCPTAFQHCIHTVAAQWLFHLCTPSPLLPRSSPFPSPPAFPALLTSLSKTIPPHEALVVLTDLIVMLFHHTSVFPCQYITPPALPLPPYPFLKAGVTMTTCQRLHGALNASGVTVTSVLERLLLETPSPRSAVVSQEDRLRLTLVFLSSMIASGVSSAYSTGLQSFLFHHMSTSAAVSVSLLSAITSFLYSSHLPLFEPTVNACRRWKERTSAEVDPASVDGQLLALVVEMAQTHRTISDMMGVTPSETAIPPSPLNTFTRCPAHETWLGIVSFYSASPTQCIRTLTRYCHTSSSHRREWENFLRSSLNPALFQGFFSLAFPPSEAQPLLATSPSSPSRPQPSSISTTYHSLSSFLNTWVQPGHSGCGIIAAILEPLPTALSALLTPSSTTSTYVSGTQVKSALSSHLRQSLPSTSSRVHSPNSFAPPHLPSLCSAVLAYLAALSSPFSSCLTVISALVSFNAALPPAVVEFAVNRWLKRSVLELSDSDEMRRRAAGKGLLLSLVLCEELHLDPDVVWDAELSEVYITQLLRYSMQVQRRTLKQGKQWDKEERLPSMPPLMRLMAHLLSSSSLNQRWLPQLLRSTRSSSIPWLLQSSQLRQMLASLLLPSPLSPLSVHMLLENAVAKGKEWLDRLREWGDQVLELQRHPQAAAAANLCVCDEVDFLWTGIVSAEKADAVAEAEVMASSSSQFSPQRQRKESSPIDAPTATTHEVSHSATKKPGRKARNGLRADVEEEGQNVVAHSNGMSYEDRQQLSQSSASEAAINGLVAFHRSALVETTTPFKRSTSELTDESVAAFLQSSAFRCLTAGCAHRRDAGDSACGSALPPPFPRWLRWVLAISFIAPAPAERCYEFISIHYYPLIPINHLLIDSFLVAVSSARRRRRAGLCPFLTPELPPLLDRMLRAAPKRETTQHSTSPHWLLRTLLALLSSPNTSLDSVEEVLRAVPRLQEALLPSTVAVPSALLHRLVLSGRKSDFLMAWLLQSYALYWEHSSQPNRAIFIPLIQRSLSELRKSRPRETIHSALLDADEGFNQQVLGLWDEAESPLDPPPQASVEAADQEDEQSDGFTDESADDTDSLSRLVSGADVQWLEVDWPRVCDDDSNLAVLQKVERDKKTGKRLHIHSTGISAEPQRLEPSDAQPHPLSFPVLVEGLSREAQTQTTDPPFAATVDAPADDVDVLSVLLPSFISPSFRAVPSAIEALSPVAPGDEDVLDSFTLPAPLVVSPLNGFITSHFMEVSPLNQRPPSPPPPPPPARPRPPSMLPPTARAVTFTPLPRLHSSLAGPSSPPRPLPRVLPSPSPLVLSSSPLDSGGFAHLRSTSITVKRSIASSLLPPVVDVATQMELRQHNHQHHVLHHDTQPPWVKATAVHWAEEEETLKRRRMA